MAIVSDLRAASPGSMRLGRRRRSLALRLTCILILMYSAYLLLVLFTPEAMNRPVAGHLSLGLALGGAAVLVSLALATFYVATAPQGGAHE